MFNHKKHLTILFLKLLLVLIQEPFILLTPAFFLLGLLLYGRSGAVFMLMSIIPARFMTHLFYKDVEYSRYVSELKELIDKERMGN